MVIERVVAYTEHQTREEQGGFRSSIGCVNRSLLWIMCVRNIQETEVSVCGTYGYGKSI